MNRQEHLESNPVPRTLSHLTLGTVLDQLIEFLRIRIRISPGSMSHYSKHIYKYVYHVYIENVKF